MNAISTTFPRRWPWCAALLLVAVACKGSETTAAPTTGSIRVTAATGGTDLDPDGYTVALQGDTLSGTGSSSQPIAVNGTVTFSQLKPGTYSLALSGAVANCPVGGQNPRTVSVTAGGTTLTTFQVTCVQRVDLSGVWNYTEVIGNPLACNDTGTYVFTKSGDGFAGTNYQLGTCDRQDGSIDNSHSSSVNGGGFVYSASGAVSVNFSAGNCFYAADVAGTPPDHLINGSGSCPSGDATWAAVRGGGPISTVTVTPPTRSVVAGGAALLRAVMIDASGSRRVDPTVTWTSDASAASVDASGVVFGVSPGSATITAAAESKSGTATVTVEVVTFATVQPGAYHSCGLTVGGAPYCWGHGTYGQMGEGAKASEFAPVAVSLGPTLAAISVGAIHTCGLTVSGAAYCWGLDYYGELGAGTPGAQICGFEGIPCSTTPLAVAGGRSFSSLAAGWEQSCALQQGDAAAYCWGDNTYGALGNGSTANSRTPVAVSGGRAFVSVGTGNIFACGLTADSAAYCWGNNSAGQLGIGPGGGPELCSAEPCSTAPVLVSGGLKFGTLSVGYWHACGLTADSTAYCWGDNGDGQLGATTTETCNGFGVVISCSTVPVPVQSAPKFATLSAGSFHSCGVAAGGDGYCWGYNGNGELGDGTGANSPTPVLIAGGLSFGAVSAFGRYHSCGLTAAGVAYCWGYNGWGQLGDGTGYDAYAPVQVIGQAAGAGAASARASRVQRGGTRGPSRQLSPRPSSPRSAWAVRTGMKAGKP